MPIGRLCIKLSCSEIAEGAEAYCNYHRKLYSTSPDTGPTFSDVVQTINDDDDRLRYALENKPQGFSPDQMNDFDETADPEDSN